MFSSVDKNLLFTRNDADDPRLGERVKIANLDEIDNFTNGVALLGYPDDEGIRQNKGRPGASGGPDAIRKYLYKMTTGHTHPDPMTVYDLGNLSIVGKELADRHQIGLSTISSLSEKRIPWISLGGGHDYGFPDGAGFIEGSAKWSKAKPLIINFDAHLDVRPLDHGITSGTPFFRLLTDYFNKFDLVELGIQQQCNSQKHWTWAQDQGATVVSLETIERSSLTAVCQGMFEPSMDRPVFLSIDIDAFCLAEAPGCSQSWPTGLRIREFLPALHFFMKSFNVSGIGIYEVAPALDHDDATAKLAALIAHEFICKSRLIQ